MRDRTKIEAEARAAALDLAHPNATGSGLMLEVLLDIRDNQRVGLAVATSPALRKAAPKKKRSVKAKRQVARGPVKKLTRKKAAR
jgi:hypothetical protein